MHKIENLLKGEIVDFNVCEVISIIENLEFLPINTLCVQKSVNGKYFCKIDNPNISENITLEGEII